MASNFYASREMAEPMLDINSRSAALRANAEAMRRELLGLGVVQAIFWFPFGLMYAFSLSARTHARTHGAEQDLQGGKQGRPWRRRAPGTFSCRASR